MGNWQHNIFFFSGSIASTFSGLWSTDDDKSNEIIIFVSNQSTCTFQKDLKLQMGLVPGRQLAIKYKFLVARGQIVVAKIPPPFFSNKSYNTSKKCIVWTFLCSKMALLLLPIPESNCMCTSLIFFPQVTFWRYKAI